MPSHKATQFCAYRKSRRGEALTVKQTDGGHRARGGMDRLLNTYQVALGGGEKFWN